MKYGIRLATGVTMALLGVRYAASATSQATTRTEPATAPSPVASPSARSIPVHVARLGPVATGDALAGGWTIQDIAVEEKRAAVRLHQGEQSLALWVSTDLSEPSGPFDVEGVRISHEKTEVPFASFKPAGLALASKLKEGAAGKPVGEAVGEWILAARRLATPRPRPSP